MPMHSERSYKADINNNLQERTNVQTDLLNNSDHMAKYLASKNLSLYAENAPYTDYINSKNKYLWLVGYCSISLRIMGAMMKKVTKLYSSDSEKESANHNLALAKAEFAVHIANGEKEVANAKLGWVTAKKNISEKQAKLDLVALLKHSYKAGENVVPDVHSEAKDAAKAILLKKWPWSSTEQEKEKIIAEYSDSNTPSKAFTADVIKQLSEIIHRKEITDRLGQAKLSVKYSLECLGEEGDCVDQAEQQVKKDMLSAAGLAIETPTDSSEDVLAKAKYDYMEKNKGYLLKVIENVYLKELHIAKTLLDKKRKIAAKKRIIKSIEGEEKNSWRAKISAFLRIQWHNFTTPGGFHEGYLSLKLEAISIDPKNKLDPYIIIESIIASRRSNFFCNLIIMLVDVFMPHHPSTYYLVGLNAFIECKLFGISADESLSSLEELKAFVGHELKKAGDMNVSHVPCIDDRAELECCQEILQADIDLLRKCEYKGAVSAYALKLGPVVTGCVSKPDGGFGDGKSLNAVSVLGNIGQG